MSWSVEFGRDLNGERLLRAAAQLRGYVREVGQHFYSDKVIYLADVGNGSHESVPPGKQYISGQIWAEVLVGVEVDGNPRSYLAIIEAASPPDLNPRSKLLPRFHANGSDRDQYDPMLVGITEAIQKRKRVLSGVSAVRSIIRLIPLDGIPYRLLDELQTPSEFPFISLTEDGKLRRFDGFELGLTVGDLENLWSGKLEDDMVKSGANLVDDLADQDTDLDWRLSPIVIDATLVERLISIQFVVDSIWLRRNEVVESLVKFVYVFFRPIELEPWPLKVFSHEVGLEYGQHEEADTEDPEGPRDTRAQARLHQR